MVFSSFRIASIQFVLVGIVIVYMNPNLLVPHTSFQQQLVNLDFEERKFYM